MNRLLAVALLTVPLSIGTVAIGQDLDHYLRIRRQYHVTHCSSLADLRDAAPNQILEIRGTVDGTFKVGDVTTLLLDVPGTDSQPVETDFLPDWLVNTGIPGRLLVKTIRPDALRPMRVVMLAAAKTDDVDRAEATAAAKTAANRSKRSSATSSRGDDRYFAASGDGALYGSIGRGGSRAQRQWTLSPEQTAEVYARYILVQNPRLSDAEALLMGRSIIRRCMETGIDPRLVVAIMLVESGFDPASVSNKGAIGLGQLMPGTARWMGVSDSYDIEQNIYASVKLLRTLYMMFVKQSSSYTEVWEKTIAAYNAGDGAVRRHNGVPPYPDTQAYVRHVIALWIRLARPPQM